jgi:hypothetical protein
MRLSDLSAPCVAGRAPELTIHGIAFTLAAVRNFGIPDRDRTAPPVARHTAKAGKLVNGALLQARNRLGASPRFPPTRQGESADPSAFLVTDPKSMSNALPELAEGLQQLHRRVVFQLVALEFAAVEALQVGW